MGYFMDRHDFDGETMATDVAAAHSHDLEVQQRYGVTYRSYWFDYERQSAFCLIEAPSAEAAVAVHEASHGSVANDMMAGDRSVDVFIRTLRQKLRAAAPGTEFIVTQHGVGYRFDPQELAQTEG